MAKDMLRWLAVIILGVVLVTAGFIGKNCFAGYPIISESFTGIMGAGLLISILFIIAGAVNILTAFLVLVSLWLLSISAAIRLRRNRAGGERWRLS